MILSFVYNIIQRSHKSLILFRTLAKEEGKMSIIAGYMVPHPPMIIPQVGRGSEAQIQKTIDAYKQVANEIASFKPETIIISSPHSVMYTDYFHISPGKEAFGDFADFCAKGVSFHETYDEDLVDEICSIADKEDFPAGTLGQRDALLDHGTMIPLYFIRQVYSDFRLVRIGLSGLPLADHYAFGRIIQQAVEEAGKRVIYIASGDLSHKLQSYGPYGFTPEGPEYDKRIMDVCSRAAFGELLDFDESFCDRAAECGHRSFVIMAGAFDGIAVEAKQLSHEDITGVGYGICTFHPAGRDSSRCFLDYSSGQDLNTESQSGSSDPYVKLARDSLTSYILRRQVLDLPTNLPSEMTSRRAGAFVSIHEHGQLRGCIGTIVPTQDCLAEEIIRNAISASTRDPRFRPVRKEELPFLEISVDVLGEPEDIKSKADLNVKRYGVIVSKGMRRGLLLPDLEGVDTVEQQIEIAKQKAGIAPSEQVSLQRFEVVRHS